VILAGGKLLEDGSLPRRADEAHARIMAAEMDGAGFAAACEQQRRPWVVVRGIADYGEPDRRKHWQYPATFVAARYVRDALRLRRLNLEN
jgi:nucleoside phosphorylase